MANCARVIITPMSERPHPERRPVDQFRPVNQVSQAREKVRRAVEDNLYASEVLIKNFTLVDLSLDDSQTEKAVRALLPVEIEFTKGRGWEDGLVFALGKSIRMLNDIPSYPNVVIPQESRGIGDIELARNVVSEHLKAVLETKDGIVYEHENYLEEKASKSMDGYIDLKMFLGEEEERPYDVDEFFKPGSKMKVMILAAMIREEAIGVKDALDWVLGEEDENNGLAKLIEQQRQNPPRK